MSYPRVSAVIATIGSRPELLRTAVTSIFNQDYPGHLEVVVSYDYVEIDSLSDLEVPVNRSLLTVQNTHVSGLAGGRNTGIETATGELVGFCDDDDFWFTSKVSCQVELWQQRPDAVAVSSGITVRSGGKDIVRLAPETASFDDFLVSRITEIHPSAMLYRRADLVEGGRIGAVDELLPASYGEDYDLLLRATRHGEVYSVQEPLVLVLWDRPSFFAGKWQNIAAGLTYLLQKFPEFERTPKGTARIAGQVAFVHAALGNRSQALAYAQSTLRRNPLQLRAWAALPVAWGLISPDILLKAVEKTGRGL
ncbi:glycosyltransferase [Rothia sp. ZJ932]|uniref:glycosyltransferase family 2 protein n=1 Tax=Rothia sp. ZJ932 TaxID=2810516 RepID=UPI00196862F5|nr:glycosyltransferase [Rothia sp. ZJ932]QRZ61174.1 glycosyltransferase [Rothia sp. ZJ932]